MIIKKGIPIAHRAHKYLGQCLIVFLGLGLSSVSLAVTQDTVIDVTGGQIQGVEADGITYFRGVPYAADSGGGNRFRNPQPVTPWAGVRDASETGDACVPGNSGGWGITPGETESEDCLVLNVATPTKRWGSERHPIMVWIHGGGWQDGSGAGIYNPKHLVNDGDLVVVTINYRMGAFGFGWHDALNNTEGGSTQGNYAMHDMIQALQWVQDNAESFGGDPSNVTIFGESAGGWSMCNLLASPHASGLFHRAIMESGGCPAMTAADAQSVMQTALDTLGCSGSDAEIRTCLESATVEEIQNATTIGPNLINMAAATVIDGDFLPQHPLAMIEQGLHNKVPVMLGTNHDEIPSLIFAGVKTDEAYDELVEMIFPDPADREVIASHYNTSNYVTYANALGALQTDVFFRCQTRTVAGALYDNQGEEVYLYEFNPAIIPGTAIHTTEMLYLFINPTLLLPIHYDLHKDMLQRWTSFAIDGAPSNDWWDRRWYAYNTSSHSRYHLGHRLSMEYPADDGGCDALDSLPTVRYMEQPDEWMMVFGTPLMELFGGLLD